MKRMNAKGFTLVELCVVIALISIVMALMISFLVLFQPRVVQSQTRQDFIDEVSRVRDELEKWVSNEDYFLKPSPEEVTNINMHYGVFLLATSRGSEYASSYIQFSEDTGVLIIKDSYGEEVTLKFDVIKRIDIESHNSKIIKFTFTGEDMYGQEFSQTMLFSVLSPYTFFKSEETAPAQAEG